MATTLQMAFDIPEARQRQIQVGGYVIFRDNPERGRFKVLDTSDFLVTVESPTGRAVDVDRSKLKPV